MAAAVADVIQHGGTLIAEAGTGTGKTLAYLVPAIFSGKRVLVSTGTKNLQEQIFFKDIPMLREALGRPFSATLMNDPNENDPNENDPNDPNVSNDPNELCFSPSSPRG